MNVSNSAIGSWQGRNLSFAFRFAESRFCQLAPDLTGPQNEPYRRRLAAHFVQRRRVDIQRFMQTVTPFPTREEREETYTWSREYRRLFDRVLQYSRATIADPVGGQRHHRVRWWSILALLRSISSSPAAAAATLRNRMPTAEAETPEEVDELGRRFVLDEESEDQAESVDVVPGSDTSEEESDAERIRRRLLDMAREAEKLEGKNDAKLLKAVALIKELLEDGYHPILFCRFIPTAEYVARELRSRLPKGVDVVAVTGMLPPADREAQVRELAASPKRVLVCTDCLSEGINLQNDFDAVLHYDLSWNPTRHEQREGRVDRYEQPHPKIRVLTYYGTDNPIDGMVIDVLIRKHKTIRSSLGVSVPVPVEAPRALRDVLELPDNRQTFEAQFELPVADGVFYLDRTHRIVEGLATYLLDTALDPIGDGIARRAGAIRTNAVTRRTTLFLVRFRYDIVTRWGKDEVAQLAEESRLLAFEGPPSDAAWLDESAAEALLHAEPNANILFEQAVTFVQRVVEGFASLHPHLDEAAHRCADALGEAHRRVRAAARMRGVNYQVKPQLPPDVLGVFVYLPITS